MTEARVRVHMMWQQPREYWQTLMPRARTAYNGRWKPQELAHYWGVVNRGRFLPTEQARWELDHVDEFIDTWYEVWVEETHN